MSKIFAIFFVVFLLTFSNSKVHAETVKDCNASIVRTDPSQLYSDPVKTPKAKFFATVDGKTTDYSGWKMQFECSAIQSVDNAKIENINEISREKDSGGCEFHAGNHTIKVIAIIPGQGEVPQCRVYYSVINSDTQCMLDVNPQTDITSATNLTVSGSNLTSGGRFGVFFDDKLIKGKQLTDFVTTPNFSSVTVPNNLRTPNSHVISLRQYQPFSLNPLDSLNFLPTEKNYGSPLCSITVIVGTPSNPGSVIKPTGGTTGKKDFGLPVVSLGKQCGTSDDPGIGSAIGCIHTSPAAFVKDFLTFIIGIAGGLAFLMMLLGAFQMLTSAGNPETLNAGRERLTSAVIGLLFIIFAVLLLQIIGFDILRLPGFGR